MSYIVAGFFTPDYRPWADRLRASLDRVGAPHDIVEVPKLPGGWEANTMAKAAQVLAAMDRHPTKTIIWLDVDCEVRGDLRELAEIRGDVGFFIHPRRRRNGRPKMHCRGGTIVLKPNAAARRWVEAWVAASAGAQYGDVDQDAITLSLDTPGVMFEHLDAKWCCTKWDKCEAPIVYHDSASKTLPKIGNTARRLRMVARLVARPWGRALQEQKQAPRK